MITAAGSNKHNFVRAFDKRNEFSKMLFLVSFERRQHAFNDNRLFHNFFEHEMVIFFFPSILFFPIKSFNLLFYLSSFLIKKRIGIRINNSKLIILKKDS